MKIHSLGEEIKQEWEYKKLGLEKIKRIPFHYNYETQYSLYNFNPSFSTCFTRANIKRGSFTTPVIFNIVRDGKQQETMPTIFSSLSLGGFLFSYSRD